MYCRTDENELWYSPNEHLNSTANLILHLCGNIHQYIISSLGNNKDMRERDKEFSARGIFTKDELADKLYSNSLKSIEIIQSANNHSLMMERMVQGFMLSGIGIIIHVTEHYSYHTGQIIFLTKFLKNKDLGFYNGINLNKNN